MITLFEGLTCSAQIQIMYIHDVESLSLYICTSLDMCVLIVHVHVCVVPQELDCGHCLAGHTKTVVMRCDNFGGEGNFKLFPMDTPDKESQEQVRAHPYIVIF